ncbi:MAG: hypothetical protein R2875_16215 [Desulfobacterales bacterium]
MAKIDFGGVTEEVITSEEFSIEKAREILKDETIAILGYGVQGPAQALNMRDNGIDVIIGQMEGDEYWKRPSKTALFPAKPCFPSKKRPEGTVIMELLSDAGQTTTLAHCQRMSERRGCALLFPGFPLFTRPDEPSSRQKTWMSFRWRPKAPAPVRANFLAGDGINSSYAVEQDFTGKTMDRTLAIGIAVGSGYLFPRSLFSRKFSVILPGRGVLMGCLCGVMEAQYNVLRKNGHFPVKPLTKPLKS